MAKPDKKPQKPSKKKLKTHVKKTYDTTDRTDPANPVAKKGVVYSDENMTHIIFVTPDELEATLVDLLSDLPQDKRAAKIKELTT